MQDPLENSNRPGIWYWMSNKFPRSPSEPPMWKPYTESENIILEQAFAEGRKEAGVGDYVVDFSRNIQYKLSDNRKQRPIKREVY